MYLVKTPWWLRMLYPSLTWRIPAEEKILYLTFDDGPHETATPFVLDTLGRYNAKATFFCIGNNVKQHPEIYRRILNDGHATGNHTHQHLNGWKTPVNDYLADIAAASEYISSPLFRPPYGRISRAQLKALRKKGADPANIIMWDVLSADFDTNLTPEACLAYVLYHCRPGSVIVFHDSQKAWPRLSHALPLVLDHFSKSGYSFRSITPATSGR
ncbi:polysaccharide deacetylase family protein [Sediminibacterium ginsengisoli]|uniref:Peptidoglycan/xylan/chitin deacetylase, PgdA/CDA1 family n=1 Tax=Sediminibacterium ginsengisoli TaxID=413434 RepID=A0A1T4N876_9BACT|nr:polysaccharide deacetylase family protein [Sediminibacterium ginsengisoli]SJZ75335.1 Peptidoglycan/xylan/chitin deacetylase, PgdA/CDA1 family [Sediminibacterium ginsengisoli]